MSSTGLRRYGLVHHLIARARGSVTSPIIPSWEEAVDRDQALGVCPRAFCAFNASREALSSSLRSGRSSGVPAQSIRIALAFTGGLLPSSLVSG